METNKLKPLLISLVTLLLATPIQSQEHITLRTDRDIYIAGEPIWLNVLCSDNTQHQLSKISRVAYVELLNRDNTPVLQSTIELNLGCGNTRLFIPDTIKTGHYSLRGYTRLMKNYHKSYFHTKVISVINPFADKRFPKSEYALTKDTLLLFPEGGRTIANAENNILIQVLDQFGKGRKTTAYLTSGPDTINHVNTNAFGMGKFRFIPSSKKYCLKYSTKDQNYTYPLPIITVDATALSILEENEDYILMKLNMVANTRIKNTDLKLHISTSHGDFISSTKLEKDGTVAIKVNELPEGYLCAYLVNSNGNVLASRYFMANLSSSNKNVAITLNKRSFKQRGKVELDISSTHHLKHRTVSVTKNCLLGNNNWINLHNNLNNFSYSTLANCTNTNITINDLLQCFIPNKGIWQKENLLPYLPEVDGKLITGTITDKVSFEPIPDENFMLSFVSDPATIDIDQTDSLGHFCFLTNKHGLNEIIIQPLSNDTNKLNYKVELDNTFSAEYPDFTLPEFTMPANQVKEINKAIINMQVNTLYGKKNTSPLQKTQSKDTLSFYGFPNYFIPIGKYIELTSTEEIIKELVPLTFINKRKGKYFVKILEPQASYHSKGVSFIIVDGVPIKDFNRVLDIPAEDIDRIELVNLNYYVDGIELGRILSVFTRQGDLSALEFDERIFRQSMDCYSYPYDFNGPDYSENKEGKHFPDFRNVLYWDSNPKNKLTFFTSDENSEYTVTVEGINAFGQVERYHANFEVTAN